MAELEQIKAATNPGDILLVVDAMAGQDAIKCTPPSMSNSPLVVLFSLNLTAMPGWKALSVKAVTGKPIKFVYW